MIFPSAEFDDAVASACHGTIAEETLANLIELLRQDAAARDEYLWQTALHAHLAHAAAFLPIDLSADREPAGQKAGNPPLRDEMSGRAAWSSYALALAGVVTVASLLSLVVFRLTGLTTTAQQPTAPSPVIARFGPLDGVNWVAPDAHHRSGDPIVAGQQLELSSGTARIDFVTGASVSISGPAIFEAQSSLAGRLTVGQVQVTASTPESKGFTIHTRTARFVDLGTEFNAEATADGHCRVDVISGEVLVHLAGSPASTNLRQGEMLAIEPGGRQVSVRIERGDETPQFRFATIEPPSDSDYADASQGTTRAFLAGGQLMACDSDPESSSGPVARLVDGRAQGSADAPLESVFFAQNVRGAFVFDLGQLVTIRRVNSFSWHRSKFVSDNHVRATQKYTLWGYAGDEPPAATEPSVSHGWERIARVNTDSFFDVASPLDRPAQQACSIASETDSLGRYRFLLFEVHPTLAAHDNEVDHTFFGEIDVYAEP
jgi:hypothetical protein